MKLFAKVKDGGPESKVTAYFLIEAGSREAYHTHAFNCISWLLSGSLLEIFKHPKTHTIHSVSIIPIITRRSTFHQVFGISNRTWVLTFRGPWSNTWVEYITAESKYVTLTHGRIEV